MGLHLGWVWVEFENELVGGLWAIVGRVRVLGVSIERIVTPCMKGGRCGWGDGPLGFVTVCNDGRLVAWRRPTFNANEADLRVIFVGEERFGGIASCWSTAEEIAV